MTQSSTGAKEQLLPSAQPDAEQPSLSKLALIHAPWLIVFVATFAPTFLWLCQRWTANVYLNAHGLLMPFIVAYLVRAGLRMDRVKQVESSRAGFLLLGAGFALVVIDSVVRTQLLSALALVVCMPGLSLLLLGARRTKMLAIPWAMALLMLPIPAAFVETVQLKLRRISAAGAEEIVRAFGTTVSREDTTLQLGNASLEIADACSGFSALYATIAFACILAYVTVSRTRRTAVLLAAAPAAIASNVLRCSFLAVLVDSRGSSVLETSIHPLSGILTILLAGIILSMLARERMERAA